MKKRTILFLLLSCILALSQAKKSTAADPWAGTYKLDTAKSKFHNPAPKDETATVDAVTKTSIKYTLKGTDAEGKPYTVTYDGKPGTPAPVMVDGKEMATLTYQMPSTHQLTSEEKGGDGSTSTGKINLSKDNKTVTVQIHHKDAKNEYDETVIYSKQ
jgi:hypothetical protein